MVRCKKHRSLSQLACNAEMADACAGCKLKAKGFSPPFDKYPLRNKDHRFEWTRAQFSMWAEDLARANGYRVRFDGIGGGAWDEEKRPGDRFHGPGPRSQVAIFERPAGDLPLPASDLQGQPAATDIVWSSVS